MSREWSSPLLGRKKLSKFTAMNLTAAITILAGFSFFGAGCATPPPTVREFENPMPKVWAMLEGQIAILKKVGATQAQWTKAADNALPISSIAELRGAIAATGVPADAVERERQQEHLERLFRTSHHVIHFGFECDFHAIVFFDSRGRQLYAHP